MKFVIVKITEKISKGKKKLELVLNVLWRPKKLDIAQPREEKRWYYVGR